MEEKFPNVKLTDLRINPTLDDGITPADQCSPCTSAPADFTDDAATNYCDPNSSFFAYDFIDVSADDGTAVTDDASVTTSLFFKAGNCGTLFDTDNTLTSTSIGKSAFSTDKITTAALLLGTGITCEYPSKTIEKEIIINADDSNAVE